MAVTTLMQDQVTQLYIGFFGRAPDADGFGYWVNGMSNGVTQQAIANSFSTSPEFIANYNGLTPSQAVTKMYNNILNRAPDAAGLTFWANSISAGQNTLSTCVVAILNSCVAQGTATTDGALVANKTAVGEYFAITLASSDKTVAATAFNNVTSDASSVTTAEASLQTAAATQINITTATPGTFTGGAANTTFNAATYFPTGTTTLTNTLVNGDSLVGNVNYTNTLNTDLIAGSNVKPTLTNIQNLVITNEGTTTLDLSNANAASAASVTLNALNGNMTLANVQNATAAYTLQNLTTGGLTVSLGSGVGTGASDTIKVTANKVSGTTGYLDLSTSFETLQLTSTAGTTNAINTNFAGTNSVGTGGITVLGAGNLTLLGSASSTISAVSLNASAFTGTFATTASDAVTTTINLGSGNDTISLLDGTIATATGVSVNLGGGTNTLIMQDLAQVSSESSIVGGAGADTLQFTGIATGTAATFKNVSGIETLKLAAGSNTSNVITLGTNFTNAGFTSVVSSGTGDNITVAAATLTGQTFSNTLGTGTGTLVLNTAGGTFTVTNYGTVDATNGGTGTNAITVNGTGNTTVTAAYGTQNITLAATALETLTLAGTGKFAVTGSSHTGDAVILGVGTGTTGQATITGGSVGLTVDASASTAANTIAFTAGTNTLTVNSLQNVSAATSITGGSGADTLQITNTQSGAYATDASLKSVASGIETLKLLSAGTNVITLGTNFTNAGFTNVTSMGTGDTITVAATTLAGQVFTGTGTGSNTLTLNTAGGSVTVSNYQSVVGNGSTNALSVNGTAAGNIGISLKAGSSVTNLNTFNSTVVLTGASTFLGNMSVETITLGSGAAQTITGGGNNDVVTLGANTSNATVTVGLTGSTVNTGTLSVVGSTTAIDAVTISGAGSYATTGVNTVTLQAAGTTISGDTIINNTGGMNVSYTYTLAAGDTGSFTFGAVDAVGSGGTIVLTANAVGNDVITLNNGDWFGGATESANVSIIANGGQNTISLSASNYSSEHIGVSLATLGNSTNTSNAFVLSNFNIGSGADTINFYGTTLVSAAGNATPVLNQNYVDTTGNNNTNTYTSGTTFVTGTSTLLTGSLANLTSSIGGAANSNGLIFDAVDSASLIGTANFTLQSGINMAVSYITTNIGESGTGTTQKAIIAVHDGVAGGPDTALFLFTSDGVSGIVASELKLIGTLNGAGVNLAASNFS